MSGVGWRTASTYLVLVGLPLAGLFAILHAGSELDAPPVVAGRWTLEVSDPGACFEETSDSFTIDQSGRFLQMRSAAVLADARLEGEQVRAAWTANRGPCAGGKIALEAQLDGETMRGELRAASCGACPSAGFEAHRKAD